MTRIGYHTFKQLWPSTIIKNLVRWTISNQTKSKNHRITKLFMISILPKPKRQIWVLISFWVIASDSELPHDSQKASDVQFSDTIYTVTGISGGNIELNSGVTVKRSQLLKVTGLSTSYSTKPNVLVQASKSAKVDRVLKADGIDRSNIIKSKRSTTLGGIDHSNILTSSRRTK